MNSNQPLPEEYTDGYVVFMGQRFITDKRALIPRLETEELVKYCLKFLEKNPQIQTIADIGTGSGIIPISLGEKMDRPLKVFATDMSQDALDVAEENFLQIQNAVLVSSSSGNWVQAERHEDDPGIQVNSLREASNISWYNHDISSHLDSGSSVSLTSSMETSVRNHGIGIQNEGITFLQGDLLQPIIRELRNSVPEEILITANLPYVREVEINSWLMHEPRMAFLGGVETGFELYERFFDQILDWKHRPRKCHVVIEFWLWQRDIAETLFQKHGFQYSFFADLRGIERFAYCFL